MNEGTTVDAPPEATTAPNSITNVAGGRGRLCNNGRGQRRGNWRRQAGTSSLKSECSSNDPTNHPNSRLNSRGRGLSSTRGRGKYPQAKVSHAPHRDRSLRQVGNRVSCIGNTNDDPDHGNSRSVSSHGRGKGRVQVRRGRTSPQTSRQGNNRSLSEEGNRQHSARQRMNLGEKCKAIDGGENSEEHGVQNHNSKRKLKEKSRTETSTKRGSKSKAKEHVLNLEDLGRLLREEPSIVILSLVAPSNGLQARLTDKILKPKMTIQLLQVLALAFKSNIHPENQHYLIGIILNSNLFAIHIPMLVTSILDNKEYWDVFESLTFVFHSCLRKMPVLAANILIDCVKLCGTILYRQTCESRQHKEIKTSMMSIETALKDILDEKRKQATEKTKSKPMLDANAVEPPEDFRKLPIIPSIEEITTNTQPFLRKNIIVGKYKNVLHYLDIQFRLLREDFIAPLRQGIDHYVHHDALNEESKAGKHAMRGINAYKKVEIGEELCMRDGIVYRLYFDVSALQRIDWEMSRRLIYGSLLCLSADNFKTVHFATVSIREPEEVKYGMIGVKFEGVDEIDIARVYVMIESPAYFEACRHILKGLQLAYKSMPFQNHIIHVNRNVKPPYYLNQTTVYDMSCVLEINHSKTCNARKATTSEKGLQKLGHYCYFQDEQDDGLNKHEQDNTKIQESDDSEHECGKAFSPQKHVDNELKMHRYVEPYFSKVLDINCWPGGNELGLDESQKQAMHLALTSSLALIQGPPGTGKTFIGLKIVQVLLHNRTLWDCNEISEPAPILVVCLTNHALDQFLEGMLHFTKRMVRIGSRSKNSALDNYNIRHLRRHVNCNTRHSRRHENSGCYDTENMRRKLKEIKRKLEEVNLYIQLLRTHILHENALITELVGEDKQLIQKLKTDFVEMFGISLQDDQWCLKSFLATWLGLTLEPFVPETEVETFNTLSEVNMLEVGSVNSSMKSMPIERKAPSPDAKKMVVADEPIKTEGAGTTEQYNRLLDEDPHEDFSSNPITLKQNSSAVDVRNLSAPGYHFPNVTLEPSLMALYSKKGQLRRKIAERELLKTEGIDHIGVSPVINMWTLSLGERWRLYRRWIQIFRNRLMNEVSALKIQYEQEARRMSEAKNGEDLEIMRQSDVVGMTTTGAAKYHDILQELGPKIVIVEEAAAVLESHIVTALTERTQHLILIGDHQQLRPMPTVYKLAKDYHLDVSLFERMINNGVRYQTLQLQHRMRPEISQLFMPLFYASVEDHQSVRCFENIKGLTTNVFFVNHSFCEEVLIDSTSHANMFEANFLVNLCWYLIQQGYKRERITILTTYVGQQFAISKLMKRSMFEGVRVTVVDNYQGEENDIILLSFVRSNEEGIIGFLKTENRVNVALSRARKGLYCIGNFEFLAKKCELWRRLVTNLERDEKIGPTLEIACQKHPDTLVEIEQGDDFKRFAPEGGCLKKCTEIPLCGHVCQRMCHPDPHKCKQQCERFCDMNHPCPLLCHEECQPCNVLVEKYFLVCEHSTLIECHRDISEVKCTAIVEKTLNKCGHLAKMECHFDPNTFKCREGVKRLLHCNHVMILECHVNPNTYTCLEKVERVLKCEHVVKLECHVDASSLECQQIVVLKFSDCKHQVPVKCFLVASSSTCPKNCDYQLQCGHICPKKCHPLQDVEHKDVLCRKPCQRNVCERGHQCQLRCFETCPKCKIEVEKELPCDHKAFIACSQNPEEVFCTQICKRGMTCGHNCTQYCGDPCGKCKIMVEKPLLSCNHRAVMKCMDDPSLILCREKCNRLLPCGHFCTYMCHAPCSKQCKHLVPAVGLCGHAISVYCHVQNNSATEMLTHFCQTPCDQLLLCGHRCKGTCGECRQGRVHVPCREKCGRVQICGHACDRLCYQMCVPCKRKCPIRCTHIRCPKKCGQVCMKCNKPCVWRCRHDSCNKQCGEICTRPRCNQPCKKKLPCSHQCIGLCGEKCPTLCRICNHDELSRHVFFGFKYDANARFIQLEHCDHCIDVRAMDHWMDVEEDKIQMKGCLICSTTVWCSRRYRNLICKRMLDVHKVKNRFLDSNKSLTAAINRLQHMLRKGYSIQKNYPAEVQRWLDRLYTPSALQQTEVVVIENQINMLKSMLKLKDMVQKMHTAARNYFDADMTFLVQRLLQNGEHITEYELRQINQEIHRVFLQALAIEAEQKFLGTDVRATKCFANAKAILAHSHALTESDEKDVEISLKTATHYQVLSGVAHLERAVLLRIPNLSAGSWYKCVEGHIYSTDTFDKDSESVKCSECNVQPANSCAN